MLLAQTSSFPDAPPKRPGVPHTSPRFFFGSEVGRVRRVEQPELRRRESVRQRFARLALDEEGAVRGGERECAHQNGANAASLVALSGSHQRGVLVQRDGAVLCAGFGHDKRDGEISTICSSARSLSRTRAPGTDATTRSRDRPIGLVRGLVLRLFVNTRDGFESRLAILKGTHLRYFRN